MGVGQRRFLLHDGRASDLLKAIEAHASPASDCDNGTARSRSYRPSEANMIIDRFRALATDQKHVNRDFLRAL